MDTPNQHTPPRWAQKLLQWRCPEDQLEEIQGDLAELFEDWLAARGPAKARWQYALTVIGFLRPIPWRKFTTPSYHHPKLYHSPNTFAMLLNYFKIAWRNLARQKAYSGLNIVGLSAGMAVALLIGLWIHDELSFNKHFQHYPRIAQVIQHQDFATGKETWWSMPYPMGNELRQKYGSYFTHVVRSTWNGEHLLTVGDKKITRRGNFMEPAATELLSLSMLRGTRSGLKDINTILLSETLAEVLFGEADPVGKILKLDNKSALTVTGVYEDMPYNSDFRDLHFIATWELFKANNDWLDKMTNPWGNNMSQVLVQIAPNTQFEQISAKIKDIRLENLKLANDLVGANLKPQIDLLPMADWHLYSAFKNGVQEGGRIKFVWLFGIIGVFVLLLACINFMNLSTARSEKRAKEVGIRKAMGSLRMQLIQQFLGESLLFAALAFVLSLLLAGMVLPWFNMLADKQMKILWTNPYFWLIGIGFSVFTGLLAGSYPALYLSSFQPVKVLKGTFRVGRMASLPRKVLVVVQFTVSVTLIIGTLLVYQQIQYAKNRPVGYSRAGLVSLSLRTDEIRKHLEALKHDLLQTGLISGAAYAESPVTELWITNSGFDWKGKPAGMQEEFATVRVSHEYGSTVGWELKAGRDFSKQLTSDSATFILNEAAVKYMGLTQPVGEVVKWGKEQFTIIGVVKDLVMSSPYSPVKPTLFVINPNPWNFIITRTNPTVSTGAAIAKMSALFKKYDPATPFEYKFVDEDYARKFENEERIGKLAAFFTGLAIFISCLGLFGLASFVAEQRTKEIGIRKVLGASVVHLWGLLSKDFVYLVAIALLFATPLAWYFLSGWLKDYEYRTSLSVWIFLGAGMLSIAITLLTVSFQAIKASLANPVKSLRSE